MNLKTLSNTELASAFGSLVQTERKITGRVLVYIIEIENRKLYLEKAYPSIYAFLVEGHGYTSGAAWRRISAAGLLKDAPELLEKVECGALNLSQLAEVQKVARAVQKSENRKVDIDEKRDVLKKLEFASQEKNRTNSCTRIRTTN